MKQFGKSILLFGILTGTVLFSFADRGIRKKSKARVMLNVPASHSFKSHFAENLNNGLKYKGSLLMTEKKAEQSIFSTNLITYQKGNTIYILPVKQKVLVPELNQGYTGMKLIIKPR